MSTTKLYIGSIGDLGDDHLRKYFQDFGNVAEVDTQQDKGQAFVTFVDHDSVDRCVSQKHTVRIREIYDEVESLRNGSIGAPTRPNIAPIESESRAD